MIVYAVIAVERILVGEKILTKNIFIILHDWMCNNPFLNWA